MKTTVLLLSIFGLCLILFIPQIGCKKEDEEICDYCQHFTGIYEFTYVTTNHYHYWHSIPHIDTIYGNIEPPWDEYEKVGYRIFKSGTLVFREDKTVTLKMTVIDSFFNGTVDTLDWFSFEMHYAVKDSDAYLDSLVRFGAPPNYGSFSGYFYPPLSQGGKANHIWWISGNADSYTKMFHRVN